MVTLKIREVTWLVQVLLETRGRATVSTSTIFLPMQGSSWAPKSHSKPLSLEKKEENISSTPIILKDNTICPWWSVLLFSFQVEGPNTVTGRDKERKWKKRKKNSGNGKGVFLIGYRRLKESTRAVYTHQGRMFFLHSLSCQFSLEIGRASCRERVCLYV